MFKPQKLDSQKVVFITGSSEGIGLATAERFAKENDLVYATVRNPENAVKLQQIAKQYPNIIIKQLDVTDTEENIHKLIKSIGKIDILINNAGVGLCGPVETLTESQVKHVFDVNLFGVLKVTNAILPGMRARKSGRIINLSSIVGPIHDRYQPAYSASKAALDTFMDVLR